VGARGDDRVEGDGLAPHAPHGHVQVQRDVPLGPPGQPAAEHVLQRPVGQRRRRAQLVQLVGVLARPQLLDGAAGRHELDLLADHPRQAGVLADAEMGIVEAQPERLLARQRLGRAGEDVRGDRALPGAVELLGGLQEVAEVGDEAADPGAHHRQPVRSGEAGDVPQVDQVVTSTASSSRSATAASRRLARSAATAVGSGISVLKVLPSVWSGPSVALGALAHDRGQAEVADHGDAAEVLAGVPRRTGDLDGGQAGELQRVADGPCVVGPTPPVQDDAVRDAPPGDEWPCRRDRAVQRVQVLRRARPS
jgi:hypothetical protein